MTELFTIENLANLGVLIFLQAVLGFDNLLYISIESKRAPEQYQAAVRRWGILIAIALRILLLFVMIKLIGTLTDPFFHLDFGVLPRRKPDLKGGPPPGRTRHLDGAAPLGHNAVHGR